MAITVTLALADGIENQTNNVTSGGDGTNALLTITNNSASSVNLTSASVSFTNPNFPGLIGAITIPQGGYSITASGGSITISTDIVIFSPPAIGAGAAFASGPAFVVGYAQVSDGSTGSSSQAALGVNPAMSSVPPNVGYATLNANMPTVAGGTALAYANVAGPGMYRLDLPVLNSELYLFPSLFALP